MVIGYKTTYILISPIVDNGLDFAYNLSMSLERWKEYIKTKHGFPVNPDFFISDAEEIKGTSTVTVNYLVVDKEGNGLEPGVYIQPNVTAEVYNANPVLRSAIRSYVCLDLMGKSSKAPSLTKDVPYLDFANAISFQQFGIAPNGAIVLKLTAPKQEEVQEKIKDVESGNTRMKFIPKSKIS